MCRPAAHRSHTQRRAGAGAHPRRLLARLLPFVGELESAEFHRQAAQLQQAWGTGVVAQPQSVPGCHHLTVLHALADSSSALNHAVRGVLGLKPTR